MTAVVRDNVIRLYQRKPELALQHLKRTTGLDFDAMPQSLAAYAEAELEKYRDQAEDAQPPILTDIVDIPVKRRAE